MDAAPTCMPGPNGPAGGRGGGAFYRSGLEPERPRRWLELLFYSFSNLSATGLGDVLPVSSAARVLTMLEQFAGVGYIATVVSRLIGLTINRTKA